MDAGVNVSEQSAVQIAEELQPNTNIDVANDTVVELISAPTWATEEFHPYDQPEQETTSPLEYAFHLLNGVYGRTVIDLECGAGLNTVILAKLGARVISIDRSDLHIEMTAQRLREHGVSNRATLIRARGSSLPAPDSCADRVLCHSILRQPDPIVTARQIRRVLKPGGCAVFHELVDLRPRGASAAAIPKDYVRTLSRAVGVPGPRREFWLVTGLLRLAGVDPSSPIGRASQRLDSALFRRFPFTKSLATVMVWEARKEG
jgi:SAM-dependent methyltransferase